MGGRVLYLDGLHQANDSASMVQLHRQIGLLAMALHPSPKRALVIGLGGGVTAGAASLMDGATVDVVELSDTVVRAAAWFRHVNHDVLRRPNVRLRVDDGRNYLLTTRERYDVITADIIQPIHAGAGSLYSREYFRLARRALADGGLMLQWIGERPRTHYLLIMRTFLDAFPETTLWVGGQLMIGAAERVVLDPAGFERKLSRPGARRALEAIGIRSFADLQALYTAGPDDLRAFVGPGPVLTDDRPLVEYHRSLPADEPLIDLRELTGKRPASSASRRPRPDPGGP
jgi:spermidine synthase